MKNECSRIGWILLAACAFFSAAPLKAQDYSHIRIVRLSFVEGDVEVRRPGGDWQTASLNLPIQHGFALKTGDGYAEVEFEHGLAMRLASSSSLEFTELALAGGRRITRLNLSSGTALIDADLARNEELSVTSSNFQVEVPHTGSFRVDASSKEAWVTVFHGKVDVASGTQMLSMGGGRAVHETAGDVNSLALVHSPQRDAFDKWVSQRQEGLLRAEAETSDYFKSTFYTTGFADLGLYGVWSDIPGYGLGWQPYGLGLGWMPFVNGQWMFMTNTGWNWVSGEPWGWLPYHFGAWYNDPGIGWMWMPYGGPLWQPATASWVQVNNQLGWTPNLAQPAKPLKAPPKGQPPASRQVVIISSAGPAGDSIRAGKVMSLAPGSAPATSAAAPLAIIAASSGSAQSSNRPANARPANAGLRNMTGPMHTFQGPALASAPTAGMPSAAFANAHPIMQAPHSLPVAEPAFPRSSGNTTEGGFLGARGNSGGVGTRSMSSPSASTSSINSGSTSRGVSGSGSHR